MRDDDQGLCPQTTTPTTTTAEDETLVEQGSVTEGTQSGPFGRAFDNGFGYRA